MTTLAGEPVPAAPLDGPMAAATQTFFEGLAAQDFELVASTFSDEVHMRALLPGELREFDGVAKVGAAFARWFGNTEAYEIVDTAAGVIGTRLCLRWRVRLQAERLGPGWFVVEQESYADLDDDNRVRGLSLLCSGYLPERPDD
ncbi:MAG: nuclear transport factor 2 family protein [Acidimicrobiales bacterium]